MTVRLAVGQMDPMIGDTKGNMKKMQEVLVSASDNNVDVLVLPELINSGYVFESQDEANSLSESIPDGDFSKTLQKWSE
ncbi:MAG: nitrilase-related carbon-nitrogen hydrolase, partial [Candidatus Thorarchaeota archaeon]